MWPLGAGITWTTGPCSSGHSVRPLGGENLRARLGLKAPAPAPAPAVYAAAEREALEEQNEVLAGKLASKVEELRELSLGIATEATAVDLEETGWN